MKGLSDSLKAEIRFQSNYLHLKDSLLVLNRDRFVALGDDACQAFVRHAITVADEFHLQRTDSAAYLLFLMSYLGSWFHTDLRHDAIRRALSDGGAEIDRIAAARAAFLRYAGNYIGETGELSVRILAGFAPRLAHVTDSETSLDRLHGMLIEGCPFTPEDLAAYPRSTFEAEAVSAAQFLRLDPQIGPKVCLAMTFTLGRAFFEDPLYPWVRDKLAEAAAAGTDAASHLFDYAAKRMRRMMLTTKGA